MNMVRLKSAKSDDGRRGTVAEVPIAVLLGAAFLNERLPRGTFIGGTCVLVAVVTALVGDRAARRSLHEE